MKKYETVMAWLRDNIKTGQILPGEKLPSEPELMRRFGVSRNSVRQAIGGLIRENLVESRHGVGSFCIRRAQARTMLLGFVTLRLNSYIFPRIIQGCNRVAQKNGFTLLINETFYDAEQERKLLLALR
ncbi:GntR family transcriptional regulator, partial [Salinispira pacifica]